MRLVWSVISLFISKVGCRIRHEYNVIVPLYLVFDTLFLTHVPFFGHNLNTPYIKILDGCIVHMLSYNVPTCTLFLCLVLYLRDKLQAF